MQNKIIQVEPPRVNKNNIIQCVRCQQYGHTKTYCNKPFVCVKCGGPHNSKECNKHKDKPAKCALCGGSHPPNYKGCEHYHNLAIIIKNFLEEFKGLFTQLLQQNSMILNMLTTLINPSAWSDGYTRHSVSIT